ncbi:MAG: corrinoid protein [Deltaproteobacteria bacterium]|jgi:5-methyltetrahydrofolate--homocysteine methyltransferase|nr:corrinoid protein [Deltaproteobacteria bacterium]
MSIKDVYQAVVDFDDDAIAGLVDKEVKAGTPAQKILDEGLIAAMDYVGKLFSEGELFVPEMLMAATAMKAGLTVLKPVLAKAGSSTIGTCVIGTVKGDLHDIGKNLVGMMLEGGGFEVYDLGSDVEPAKFVAAAKEKKAQIVGLSALLTTTMPYMEETVNALKEAGLTSKVIIGGAPVTAAYAEKIGAAGYSDDAPGAVELARSLLK